MKKILQAFIIICTLSFAATEAKAQAWTKDSKVLSIGLGASQFFHIDNYYYGNGNPNNFQNWYTPLTGQFNFQGEFGVHRYWGIGFTTGIGGRGPWANGYNGEINIPMGMIVNFHFYQLIADKRPEKNIHSDKLDIYVGGSLGGGIALTYYPDVTRIVPMAFGGPHAGIRYYFTKRVAVNGEVGFGKSIVNVGLSFKL
jgi:hypothetical protein